MTSTSNGNTPQPPSAPSPALNGNGENNGNGSISSIPGFGTAPVAASSPAGSSSTPIPTEAARPLGGMNDDQKRDVVRNLSPAKIANIRKVRLSSHSDGASTADKIDARRHAGCWHDQGELDKVSSDVELG